MMGWNLALSAAISIVISGVAWWSMRSYSRSREKLVVFLLASCLLAVLWQEHWLPGLEKQLQPLFQKSSTAFVIDSNKTQVLSADTMRQIEGSSQIVLKGEGFRESQWQDAPARTLQWQKPINATSLQLQFHPRISLGREFELTIQRNLTRPNSGGIWRAQLLAENGVVLAEEKSTTTSVKLRWLAPVAERMVLQAKVFDDQGRLLDSGPIPLEVTALDPLRVGMRLDAPSFDAKALQNLLRQSQAMIDVQTRLGQTLQHIETPIDDAAQMNLLIVDAAFLEKQSAPALQKLLSEVAQGKNLIILGANASQTSFWQRGFKLPLQAVNLSKDAEIAAEIAPLGTLSLSPNAFAVKANEAKSTAIWMPHPQEKNSTPWMWQRSWQKGQIAWLAVGDWHRHAIASPQKLMAWWQSVLDQVHQKSADAISWSILNPMPINKERQIICLQGITTGELREILQPSTAEAIGLQSYGEAVDQLCAAWRPKQEGWQNLSVSSSELKEPIQHAFYIYPSDSWSSWQRHLKAMATEAYAQRLPAASTQPPFSLPLWPLYLFIAMLLLYLWRQDTQQN